MRATFVDHPPAAWQAFCSKFYAELLRLRQGDPDHRQRKAEPQLVLEENLDVMQPELLELHTAKVMDIRGVTFQLLQLEFHLGLRQDLLLIHADDPRFLPEFSRAAAPARPNTQPHAVNGKGGRRDDVDHAHEGLHAVDFAADIFAEHTALEV